MFPIFFGAHNHVRHYDQDYLYMVWFEVPDE
jgi:hypothetical protein